MAVGPDTSPADVESLPADLRKELTRIESDFTLDTAMLKKITERFGEELREGLEKPRQNLAMEVTWVLGYPTGKEEGSFLVIDLGGTNLRICWITLKTNEKPTEMEQKRYYLPAAIKTSTSEELWTMISVTIEEFIKEFKLHDGSAEPLPLGFTFSFPLEQDYINHGELKTWTKGFDIKGMEGEDIAKQFRANLEKHRLPVKLVSVINDTTGAMIASAYLDPQTIVGGIFGTGCNAAYMENVGSIPKLKTSLPDDTMIAINCEYGAFDNSHQVLPRTKYDIEICRESARPDQQAFEKMSAGLYLGEIFRLAMLDLYEQNLIFKGQEGFDKLNQAFKLDTEFLSGMEHETDEQIVARYKKTLKLKAGREELIVSRRIAEAIATRGARLCSTGIAAIIKKKGLTEGHVAADGSVALKHPGFKNRWRQAMAEVLDWPSDRTEDPIIMTKAEDGSGIGAAVISAMTVRRKNEGRTEGIQFEGSTK
ncbi:hexokinase [Apiospora kogelbergensis]|uniref:Phosphotransferase n=1 Tax=Apiospora kogelbergensis TaxID=1337665 RepID=A0AAW0QPU4_9PEZI